MSNEIKTNGRVVQGVVVQDKENKTVVVRVNRRVAHKLYKKVMTRSSKLHVHDETNQCSIGDMVAIRECRPISKLKSWVVYKILEKTS